MSYTAALKMPSSYAVMNEEEMTYLEGGVAIPNWLVAGALNLAIDTVVLGGVGMAAKHFSKEFSKYGASAAGFHVSEVFRKKLIAKGVANATASAACRLLQGCLVVLTWALDPGGEIANLTDSKDCKPSNGWLDISC